MKFLGILLPSILVFAATFAHAETATLRVTTLTDYTDSNQDLDTAKVFDVDMAFAEKYNLEFYMFYREEDEICFTGTSADAAKIVDVILNTATGDAYVDANKPTLTKDRIRQVVNFQDEGGDHQFTVDLARCK